jgi:hypothetical protein
VDRQKNGYDGFSEATAVVEMNLKQKWHAWLKRYEDKFRAWLARYQGQPREIFVMIYVVIAFACAGLFVAWLCSGCTCKDFALRNAEKYAAEGYQTRIVTYDLKWDAKMGSFWIYDGHAEAQALDGDTWKWIDWRGFKDGSDYRTPGEMVMIFDIDNFKRFMADQPREFDMLICDEFVRLKASQKDTQAYQAGELGKWSQKRACEEKYGANWEAMRKPIEMNFREGVAWENLLWALLVI